MSRHQNKNDVPVLVIVLLINACILIFFHNRFWVPADFGQQAHLAERVAEGQVLGKDVQDVRPGYVVFVNALAFKLFGKRLVSLMYPLVLMIWLQSLLIFLLFKKQGLILAAVASVASICLGVVHYLDPNHHWYCAFQVILMVCCLAWVPPESKWRLPLAGFFLMNAALFRHLSAVFILMGLFAYLLLERQNGENSKRGFLGRMITGILFFLLAVYLFKATDVTGFILCGFWPLLILAWVAMTVKVADRDVIRIILNLSLGALVAALPIVLYEIIHGSLGLWLKDITVRAWAAMGWTYIKVVKYDHLISGGFRILLNPESVSDILNGIYWLMIPFIPFVNGLLVFYHAFNQRNKVGPLMIVFPFMAVFYTIVSVFNQIPIYLYLTICLSLPGLLWSVSLCRRKTISTFTQGLTVLLCIVSIVFHAGQSLVRGYRGSIKGERVARFYSGSQLPRAGLWMDRYDLSVYSRVVEYIKTQTRPDEKIFVLPNAAELYFLSERRNPFRFYSTDHAVQNEADLNEVIRSLRDTPPRMVVYLVDHKRSTPLSEQIMGQVKQKYVFSKQIAQFQFYRFPN